MKEWVKFFVRWLLSTICMTYLVLVEIAGRTWRRLSGRTAERDTTLEKTTLGEECREAESSDDSAVSQTESESEQHPLDIDEEYMTIAGNSCIRRIRSNTNSQDSSTGKYPIVDTGETVKDTSAQDVGALNVPAFTTNETEESDEEYHTQEERSMPDGEDTSDLSTTEEKDSDSDTSPTKQIAVSGYTGYASVEAFDRLNDELIYNDLVMKKSPHDGKNLQMPVSNQVRPETHPLYDDELEFYRPVATSSEAISVHQDTDTRADSAAPQEVRQKGGGSTSDKNPPDLDEPSKGLTSTNNPLQTPQKASKNQGKLQKPMGKQYHQEGNRKRMQRNPTNRSRKNRKAQHQSAKINPNGGNSSSNDQSSKRQKRPKSATQGSSCKPATTRPIPVTSRKKSSPPGKSTKRKIKSASDSGCQSVHNPAEQKPAPGRSSGDEVTLPPHMLSPEIVMPMPRESKEGPPEIDGGVGEETSKEDKEGTENAQQDVAQESIQLQCQHSAPIEQSQEHAEDTLCSGEISERDKSPGPDIIPQARSKRSERPPTAEELDKPNDEPPHAVEDAHLLPPRRPQEELALPENPDPLFWLSMMPDDPDPCRAPPEDDDGDMIDTAMIFVTPIPSNDTGGSADFVSGMFPYGQPYQQEVGPNMTAHGAMHVELLAECI